MNSTADTYPVLSVLVACLTATATTVWAQNSTDAATAAGPDAVHQALNLLQASEYARAEQLALQSTQDSSNSRRGWMIAASARQRMGQHAEAIAAYQMVLRQEKTGQMAEFARSQIQLCRQAIANRQKTAEAPSAALSQADRKQLAAVEDRVHVETSTKFVVRARNARLAKVVLKEAERSLERICNDLLNGMQFEHNVDVYVWTDRKEYLKNASDAPEWSGGSYSLKRKEDGISRRIDLTQRDDEGNLSLKMLDRILPHELAHLVIREVFQGGQCPLVVNEGLAMLAEYEIDNERIRLAGTALAGRMKISLAQLLTSHWHDLENPAVFYAEAYSLMEFVYTRLNRRQQKSLLEHMKDGSTFTDALQRALAIPHDETFAKRLEEAWQDHAIAQAQFLNALDEGFGPDR
ncbi:MAG: peptidase MA family metallohydrolase [Phycisphaerae bacterium]